MVQRFVTTTMAPCRRARSVKTRRPRRTAAPLRVDKVAVAATARAVRAAAAAVASRGERVRLLLTSNWWRWRTNSRRRVTCRCASD